MTITIEHCNVEIFGSGNKIIAEPGFALYRVDRYNAWTAYCAKHEEHPRKYPEKTVDEFLTYSRVVYLPANNDGSNYAVKEINSNMRVYG